MSARAKLYGVTVRRQPCAYCGAPAVNADHVVPKSLQKKYDVHPLLRGTVPACFECNIRKGSRRLIPESWADRLTLLNADLPGVPWRVWHGSPAEPAFRDTWR